MTPQLRWERKTGEALGDFLLEGRLSPSARAALAFARCEPVKKEQIGQLAAMKDPYRARNCRPY
jgi:hypothetical protein